MSSLQFKLSACAAFYGTVVATLRPDPKVTDWTKARFRNLRIAWELMLSSMYYDLADA